MIEIADFYQTLGMNWDAQTTRDRVQELYNEDTTD
jgi:hypothetical protein